MSAIPKLSERQAEIVEAAVRDGVFVSPSKQDTDKCRRLDGLGLLLRDLKDGARYYPTDEAKARVGVSDPADATSSTSGDFKRSAFRRKIETIDVGTRLRPVDQARVEALKISISDLGLKTPITVYGTPLDARAKLSAGGHRLEAMRQLGETHIDCFHEMGDELDAELWEIDENLARSELTAADRALFVHRRKEIYLLKHPETAQHVAGGKARHSATDKLSFADATAQATGQDARTVRRDASRGARIVDMALHHLRGTRLDSGVFLDRLKLVPEENQVLYVKAALEEEKQKAADTKENRTRKMEVRRAVRTSMINMISERGKVTAGEMPRAAFPVGYADPPWQQEAWSDDTGQDRGLLYPSMPLDEIKDLCRGDKSPFTQDALVFLWVPSNRVDDGIAVLHAWGFDFVTIWTWDKEDIGMGRWLRDRTEHILIGKRGDFPGLLPGSQPHSLHREKKNEHSRKPVFFAEEIERLFPSLRKLELFLRRESLVDGDIRLNGNWHFWGFEAGEHQEAAE